MESQELSVGRVRMEGGAENIVNIVLIDEILQNNELKCKTSRKRDNFHEGVKSPECLAL